MVDGLQKDIRNMGAAEGPRGQYLFLGSGVVSSHGAVVFFCGGCCWLVSPLPSMIVSRIWTSGHWAQGRHKCPKRVAVFHTTPGA